MAIIGKLIALCDVFLFRDAYRHLVDIYNSPVKRFLMAFNASMVFGLIVWLIMLFFFVESESRSGPSGEQCIIIGIVAGIVFIFPCMYSISAYRRYLIKCPKCGQETEITKDELLSEDIVSKVEGTGKERKLNHYRVGTRLVTIACESCDYKKALELKFKERV